MNIRYSDNQLQHRLTTLLFSCTLASQTYQLSSFSHYKTESHGCHIYFITIYMLAVIH